MKENKMHEIGKNRHAQVKMSDICNSAVIGIFALWMIWISTSVLIHFTK